MPETVVYGFQKDPSIPMLVTLGVAVLLLAAAWARKLGRGRVRQLVFSPLLLLTAGLLAAYVFSEDTYRNDGISRWDAYRSPGGALGGMFIASVASLTLSSALVAYAGFRNDSGLFRWASSGAGVCSLLLVMPTIIGFSTN
jgi:hypothetical protein